MLVFASDDARRDRDEFGRVGLTTYAPFDFARTAKLPTAKRRRWRSRCPLSRRTPARGGIFTCQQHAPQYFWKPEYQRHANGAIAVTEVVMVRKSAGIDGVVRRYAGRGAVRAIEGGLAVTTARGTITVLTPSAAAERFAGLPLKNASAAPHLVGYRVSVRDLDDVRVRFDASDVTYGRYQARCRLRLISLSVRISS